jgi:hypothetical protein
VTLLYPNVAPEAITEDMITTLAAMRSVSAFDYGCTPGPGEPANALGQAVGTRQHGRLPGLGRRPGCHSVPHSGGTREVG